MKGTRILAGVFCLSSLALIAITAPSCSDGRFPVCKTDADCQTDDAGTGAKLCFNLKCVECRYDNDCGAGKACNRSLNTCESILGTPPPEDSSSTAPNWEPANWDECAKRCKEADCVKQCDQQFKK